jgi:glyoxylase-like metal-dependent hydrolase (beta-lactamase superfamily II)
MQNFIYFFGDKDSKECVVVDPAWNVDAILNQVEKDGMKISGAFITHGHPDHINAVEKLLQKTDCRIYVQKKELEWLGWKWSGLKPLQNGDIVEIGKLKVQAIRTPGHTPGSQCLLVEDSLISGDTLFINSCGRIDLPGSNPEEMYRSLESLKKLKDDILLFPGHNYAETVSSTMGSEKKKNPYLQFSSLQEFLSAMTR